MKKIYYYNFSKPDTEILLTDAEFAEANQFWNRGSNYWCNRIEKSLSPKFKIAETPDEDVGYEVFLEKVGEGTRKIFKRNGKYFKKIKDGETERMVEYQSLKEQKLIAQEEFYKNKGYQQLAGGGDVKLLN